MAKSQGCMSQTDPFFDHFSKGLAYATDHVADLVTALVANDATARVTNLETTSSLNRWLTWSTQFCKLQMTKR